MHLHVRARGDRALQEREREREVRIVNVQQALENLIQEVKAVLGSGNIAPQRQTYFQGASDYLQLLKHLTVEGNEAKRPARVREPKSSGTASKPGSAKPEPPG